jgi:hypothetical protein
MKIINSGKSLPKIKNTGKTLKRIEPDKLSKLLGAEIVSTEAVESGSPVSLFALREYILENLRSTGGRPAIETNAKRQKIPLSEETWQALTALTSILRADGVSISPGQMASAIIRQGLLQLNALPMSKARA